MKTAEVKNLVSEVLATLPHPYSQHVIDDVFLAIESRPDWHRTYELLHDKLGKLSINAAVGAWVGRILGKRGEKQVNCPRNNLSQTYSILDSDTKPISSLRPKENDAAEMMYAYYKQHKKTLPEKIQQCRILIIEMIMEGMAVEDAFNTVSGSCR